MTNTASEKTPGIMWPSPTKEQIQLWDEIDQSLNDKLIEEEAEFQALPENIKMVIAKEIVSKKIISLGIKYKLDSNQTRKIAYIIKLHLIAETDGSNLEGLITQVLSFDKEIAQQLANDLDREIIQPIIEKGKQILKNVPVAKTNQVETPEKIAPNLPSAAPKEPVDPYTTKDSFSYSQIKPKPAPASPMPTFSQPEDKELPQSPQPRIEGNIVDLKNQVTNQDSLDR